LEKNKNFIFKIFTIFFLASGIQQFFFFLGSGVFSLNPDVSNISWWIAHLFMFIAVGSLIRVPLNIKYPQKEQLVIKIIIGYSIIGLTILFLNLPNVDNFLKNGIFNWIIPPLSGAIIGIFATTISFFHHILFLEKDLK